MIQKKEFREGDQVLLVTAVRHHGFRSYRASTVSKVLKNGNFRVECYPSLQFRQTGYATGKRSGFWDNRPVVHHDTDELRADLQSEQEVRRKVREVRDLGRLLSKMSEEQVLATWPKLPDSLKEMVKDA